MMFDISKSAITNSSRPIITDNYEVLHYDDTPILFIGSNEYGNIIIGSIMCEDEDHDFFRYLHVIVSTEDYLLFITKKMCYLKIIERQKKVFLIDRKFEGEIFAIYEVNISQIPKSYLPHQGVYNPSTKSISLK